MWYGDYFNDDEFLKYGHIDLMILCIVESILEVHAFISSICGEYVENM